MKCWAGLKKLTPSERRKLFVLLAINVTGISVLLSNPGRTALLEFIAWGKSRQGLAACVYVLLFAFGAVLHFPEVLLAAAAGYMFDSFLVALASVVCGATLGAMFAWWMARALLRDIITKHVIPRFQWLGVIDRLASDPKKAWRIVCLLRLPFVPYIAMNMALAVTQLQFRTYVTTAFVGLMPGSALYVLVGRGIQNISAFVHGDDDNLAPVVLTVTGVVISLAVFIGLGLHARKLVQREAMGHRRDSDDAFSSVDGMLGGDGMPGSVSSAAITDSHGVEVEMC